MNSKTKIASASVVVLLVSAAGFFGFRWQEKLQFEEDVSNFSKIAEDVTDPSACSAFHGDDFRAHCEDAAVSNSAFSSKNPSACSAVKDGKFRAACVKAASAALGSSAASADACSSLVEEGKTICVDAFLMYA
ncbi:MAG: hypothetical protein QMC36_04960 [Patescibacteria group bacterium]